MNRCPLPFNWLLAFLSVRLFGIAFCRRRRVAFVHAGLHALHLLLLLLLLLHHFLHLLFGDLRNGEVVRDAYVIARDDLVQKFFFLLFLEFLSSKCFNRHFAAHGVRRVFDTRHEKDVTSVVGLGRLAACIFALTFFLELDYVIAVIGFDQLRSHLA